MKNFIFCLLVLSASFVWAGQPKIASFGTPEAIELTIDVDIEECLKALQVSSERVGGGFSSEIHNSARCEVNIPGTDSVFYTEALAKDAGKVYFGASAKRYYLSYRQASGSYLRPDKKQLTEEISALFRSANLPKQYKVKALRAGN